MLKKRIIPCLDIQNGRTVKGVNFTSIRDAGEPIELARQYAQSGADELTFLDITATVEGRKTFVQLVEQIAKEIHIPFTVGGGISSITDVEVLLRNGADKVSINSAAVKRPELIRELSKEFGSQCIVLAVDTNYEQGQWWVYTAGGRHKTDFRTLDWVQQGEALGAGEILLTSMVSDGTKNGFSIDLLRQVNKVISLPVIASGGAGSKQHFADVFTQTDATAALAASVFHCGEITIPELKQFLKDQQIAIR